jgi:hypothetical protein
MQNMISVIYRVVTDLCTRKSYDKEYITLLIWRKVHDNVMSKLNNSVILVMGELEKDD